MAFVSSSNISLSLQGNSAATSNNLNLKLFLSDRTRLNVAMTSFAPFPTVLTFARRKNSNSAITSISEKKKKVLRPSKDVEVVEEGDIDEDAFEALFKQLEEDLKNDEIVMGDEDDDISEEDLVRLEREIEEALGEDGDLLEMFKSTVKDMERNDGSEVGEDDDEEENDESEDEEDEEEDDGEKELAKLKNWQIRRLASALKVGRRKTSIKSLAGELCLDRSIVLKLLRDPPPRLLLMSATLPERPAPAISEPEAKIVEIVPDEKTEEDVEEPQGKPDEPVHVMQGIWSAQKRLKKVQVETLERVYRRTKRPTNAMISSIVHVTNLPRKRVVKWFEDKREEDGVPVHRLPYQRTAADTVFSK